MSDEEIRLEILRLIPKDKCYCPDQHIDYASLLYKWTTGRRDYNYGRNSPHKPTRLRRFINALRPIQK